MWIRPAIYNLILMIESVPNVSEGRRPEVIAELAGAVRHSDGVTLLD